MTNSSEMPPTTTGSNSTTVTLPVYWCSKNHQMEVVHHFGEDGLHYCPTGFMACWECGEFAEVRGWIACTKWGEA